MAGSLLLPVTRPLDKFVFSRVWVVTTSFLFHRKKITSDFGYGDFV
jgi:hypothetical protein